eukprot:COSAG01_NODE_14204_length_1483_cov_1.812861_3_plen_27_part_01
MLPTLDSGSSIVANSDFRPRPPLWATL